MSDDDWGIDVEHEEPEVDPASTRFMADKRAQALHTRRVDNVEAQIRANRPGWKLISSWPHLRLWETDQFTYAAHSDGKPFIVSAVMPREGKK